MKNKVWNQKMRTQLMAAGLAGAFALGICGCGTGDASAFEEANAFGQLQSASVPFRLGLSGKWCSARKKGRMAG